MPEPEATSASSKPATAMEKLFGTMLTDSDHSSGISGNTLVKSYDSVKDELSRYSRQSFEINDDPLVWWKTNSGCYPELSRFAKQRLTVSATSVPSERMFSKAGQLINAKRACLSSSHVDKILFLNKNLPVFS